MPILHALLYLRLTSLKNFFHAQLRRLRQPKYLAGAVFVCAYFWFFFFRTTGRAMGGFRTLLGANDPGALSQGLGALVLTGVLVAMWLFSSDQPGLQFTEAEIAFLFPAPFTRRSLVRYKLAGALWGALLQAGLFALLFAHGRLFSREAPGVLLAWWILLGMVSLHHLGVSLTIARLAESGLRAGQRRALIIAGLILVAGALGWWIWRDMPDIAAFNSPVDWFAALLNCAALRWLLWPAKLVVKPFLAAEPLAALYAFVPALLALAAHCLWVSRMDAAFEEASIARAAGRASRLAEARARGTVRLGAAPTKGRRPPFALGRTRWVELAFLWKNLLSARPYFTARAWLGCVVTLVALWRGFSLWLGNDYWRVGGGLATLGLLGGGMALVYGPLITRLDIRLDLANADILKTYPLPGWRIVLGEMLTPIAILSGIAWLGLLAWYLGLHGHQPPALSKVWFSPAMRVVFTGCCAGLTPFLVTLQLLVPNGAAVLFPAMFRTLRTAGAGLDLMGQRLIFGFGQIFVLLVVLLPGAAAAGFLIFITQWIVGPAVAELLATGLVVLVFLGEIGCGLWWLGRRFERLDISAELRP